MTQIKYTLSRAIEAGSLVLKSYYKNLNGYQEKGDRNLVTIADKETEQAIVKIINKEFPEHDILSEEGEGAPKRSPYRWIIDPIDGTTNYVHSFPLVAISIALEFQKEIVMGAVFNPILNELYFAEKHKGVYLNHRKISCSLVSELKEGLLVTEFGHDRLKVADYYLKIYKAFLLNSQNVLRLGSAALNLCYVACGRLDGYWQRNLEPWDGAAGALIVQEAGGTVTDFQNNEFSVYKGEVLASNGRLHDQMRNILSHYKHE